MIRKPKKPKKIVTTYDLAELIDYCMAYPVTKATLDEDGYYTLTHLRKPKTRIHRDAYPTFLKLIQLRIKRTQKLLKDVEL